MFRRKDGERLIYLSKDLAEDSMFQFGEEESVFVKMGFKSGNNKLTIER